VRQPGRKSGAATATLAVVNIGQSRIRPRADAAPDVQEIICDLVGSLDARHFHKADWPLLESYARAILLERKAYRMLEMEGEVLSTRTNAWLVVAEKAGRQIVALSARLRLCPQSRMDRKQAGKPGPAASAYDMMGADHD
jgi:phage terminase small subunit